MEQLSTKKNMLLKLAGLMIIVVNLGSYSNIKGVNLSWAIGFLCLLVFLIQNKKIVFINNSFKHLALFLLFWMVYGLLQIVFSKNISLFFQFYMINVINAFLVILILYVVRTKDDFVFILKATLIAFVINIAGACYEYLSGHRLITSTNYGSLPVVGGFIGNFNDLCTFLFLAIVFFMIILKIVHKKKIKVVLIVLMVISFLIINYNGSRGGIYSVYIFFGFFILFYIARSVLNNPKMDTLLMITLILSGIIVLVLIINRIGLQGALSYLGTSGDLRSDVWRAHAIFKCLSSIKTTLGFGIGAGQSIVLLGGINVHNFYIEIITEFGLIIGICVLYLSFLLPLKINYRIDNYYSSILRSFAFSLLVAGVTSSSLNKMRMMWIMLTIIFIIQKTDFMEKKKKE